LFAGTTNTAYDTHGNTLSINNPTGNPTQQDFVNDASGRILHKTVTRSGSNTPATEDYYYAGGNPIGSSGTADSPVLDYNYTPISDRYPALNPGQYVVQSSTETLQSIALTVFGDENLWYLIADANGLSISDSLTPGQTLILPNQVSNLRNTADTFRPFDPSQIISDATPTPQAPPPPRHSSNIFATILIVAVVVVASVFTAGAAAAAFGVAGASAATVGSTFAAGIAAVSGGSALGIAAAAVGGVVGSALGQGVAIGLGQQNRFSFTQVAIGGLAAAAVAGAGYGIGQLSQAGFFGSQAQAAQNAAVAAQGAGAGTQLASNAATLARAVPSGVRFAQGALQGALSVASGQGINIALGQQQRFSFAAVAAGAITGGLGASLGDPNPPLNPVNAQPTGLDFAGLARATVRNDAYGVLNRGLTVLLEGRGRIDLANIAADGFGNALGNALGNAIVGEIQRPSGERRNPRNGFTSTARYTGPLVGGDIAQLPDSVSNALALNIGSDSIASPDAGPASAPGFTSITAQRGDSISRLLGTSNPGAIQRFKDLNGITGSSSTIFAGQTYRVPTNLTDFSAEETNGGQATLVADNNRLAQIRAAQEAATAQQTSDIDASSDVPFYLNRNSGPSFVQGPSDPGGFLADQINSGALLRDVVPALAPADRAAYLQNLTGGAVVGPVPGPPPFNPAFSLFAAFVGGPIAGLPLATTIALGGSPQQQLAAQDAGVALFGIGASLAGAAGATRSTSRFVGASPALRATAVTATNSDARFLFRGDGRTPDVIFNEGFQPRGANTDLRRLVFNNEPSNFISTSQTPNVARDFAANQGNGYVYTIRGQPQGLDVNAILGSQSPFPQEFEIAVPRGIDAADVLGSRQVGPDGNFVGPFIKNPRYIRKGP
jgi:hypothetical protein